MQSRSEFYDFQKLWIIQKSKKKIIQIALKSDNVFLPFFLPGLSTRFWIVSTASVL